MTRSRSCGMMLPAALLLCILTVVLSTALQRRQHDLAVSSALEALDLRARHAVDAAVARVRALGRDAARDPPPFAIGGFSVDVERSGQDLVIRVHCEGYRHRARRPLPR